LINSISKFGKHKGGYVNLAISQCYMFLFIKFENVTFTEIMVTHCNSIKFSVKSIMHIKNNSFCLVEIKRLLLIILIFFAESMEGNVSMFNI
jgi:hypothetical protein